MKALYFDGKLKLKDLPKPEIKEGESLIKVLLASVCNTDIEIMKGYKNFKGVLGHEFVGIVEDSSNPQLIGKRVVADINIACGECDLCKEGLFHHCRNRKVLGIFEKDGAFAEYITLPNRNLFIVPDSIKDEEAVFTEPLAAALEILEMYHIKPTDKVVVIGDGKLSQFITQVVALTGCDLYVVGKHEEKLEHLKNKANTLLLEEVERLETKSVFDVAIECTGNEGGLKLAQQLVKPTGTVILKSTYNAYATLNPTDWVVNEIKLIGTRCGPMASALRLLEKRFVTTDYLISGFYKLEQYEEAFSPKNTFKAVFDLRG
ncbi:MAG: alcohol dehydrogenase catalytic domain-containing protein [Thermoanaerobacter sp.]|uniref:MDR/zinc-dependent alcohol dehydrogenase-like family protein n=1 Tax=Caldanaerobacter subterraneus TaxID=911092 RepID=UPI0019EDAACD|nr:alcohol dehydrogenase catalytic domain-containing protein [Thermoanaerobacter sp.]